MGVSISVVTVGVLTIGNGVTVCVLVGGGVAVGGFSVTVGPQETSRTLNKVKEKIFRTASSALIMIFQILYLYAK